MLSDYKVSHCSRRCHAEDRPLRLGEWFYSVVVETDEGELSRRDYSAGAWGEPPTGALGWWKGRIPEAKHQKAVLAPAAVLVDILRQLTSEPQRAELAYLLALLLLRRRVVRLLEDQQAGVLSLEVAADSQRLDVKECEIQPTEIERLREELNGLLYCESE